MCGDFRPLTEDHIPPRAVGNSGEIEQLTLSEYAARLGVKPAKGKKGNTLRTICSNCNGNVLGSLDKNLGDFCSQIKSAMTAHLTGRLPVGVKAINFNGSAILRSLTGHLLAATSENLCLSPLVKSDRYGRLYDFVLSGDESIVDFFDFYIWPYPYRNIIVQQHVAVMDWSVPDGVMFVSFAKFFPIGFAVVEKGSGHFLNSLHKVNLRDKFFYCSFSVKDIPHADYPMVLSGMRAALLKEEFGAVGLRKNGRV